MTIPPDDYYEALGVAKDATAAAIKLAYRKLVLKHHPDKVAETHDKTAAADRFHKIQTAWETIGDDEKRSRYDAQCRLASLRREKELAERDGFATPDYNRPSPYRTATDLRPQAVPVSPRPQAQRSYSYRAVEVKPPFADTDTFDKFRTSDRRDFDFEHTRPKRTPPKDDRHRSKVTRQDSKESERARNREKGRQATKATNRDRDMKHSYRGPEILTDSDSDHYFERRHARDYREEELARERYMEKARQQAEEARSNRYMDERTQKLFSDAQDYQQRMRSSRGHTDSRRPSPTRNTSSRDSFEYTRMADGRPAAVRRGSVRPRTSSRDDVDVSRNSRRGSERDVRRTSLDNDDTPRRPPGLSQAKSAPNDIRIPLEKQRANSVQYHGSIVDDSVPPPPVRRADSMPHAVSKERAKPVRSSTLRQAHTSDDYDVRRSPTRSYQYASRSPKDYSDEQDDPVRDQYRTEVREPVGRRLTRSPSPIRPSDKARGSSTRQAPQHLPRTTSTTYTYPLQAGAESHSSRPKLSRGDSGRKDSYLFGEIPTTRSSRDRDLHVTSPSLADNVRYRETRPDVRVATGYSANRRGSDARSPSYYRQNSYNSPTVSA